MSADEIAEAVAQAKVRADVRKEAQRLQNAQAAEQVRVAHPQYREMPQMQGEALEGPFLEYTSVGQDWCG
jgi:hypothetical protein